MEFVGGEHACPLFGYMLDQTAGVDWGFTCGGVTCLGVRVLQCYSVTVLQRGRSCRRYFIVLYCALCRGWVRYIVNALTTLMTTGTIATGTIVATHTGEQTPIDN